MGELVAIIVASGKASRFGGFPKAFCEIGGEKNINRISRLLAPLVRKVYAILNPVIYERYKDSVYCCELVEITSGHGEAHSLLRGLKKIGSSSECNYLICWGDTVFMSDTPIRRVVEEIPKISDRSIGTCLCARDEQPYAWFGTDGMYIRKSYFRGKDGNVGSGIHDQSLFYFKGNLLLDGLERYRQFLQIEEKQNLSDFGNPISEMKMLYAFEYFHDIGRPMEYCMTEPGQVMSFNTKEELENIEQFVTVEE